MTFTYLQIINIQGPGIDNKFKEVKDFQQFRAKAGAVVFKVEAWSRSRSKMEQLRNTAEDKTNLNKRVCINMPMNCLFHLKKNSDF